MQRCFDASVPALHIALEFLNIAEYLSESMQKGVCDYV